MKSKDKEESIVISIIRSFLDNFFLCICCPSNGSMLSCFVDYILNKLQFPDMKMRKNGQNTKLKKPTCSLWTNINRWGFPKRLITNSNSDEEIAYRLAFVISCFLLNIHCE